MKGVLASLPPEAETIAELRELYRAAEARAARLRLLSSIGQDLALARSEPLDATLQRCARSLALFLGSPAARLGRGADGSGIAVQAPGAVGDPVAWLVIDGVASLDSIADPEDRETARMCLELMGAAIERDEREVERAGLLAILREREQRLEFLLGQIFSAQEEERRRVSQELHDGVAQTATALARMLEGSNAAALRELATGERQKFAAIARDLLRELRAVIGGLRPTLLDDLGLAAALQALADGLRDDGYAVTVRLDPEAQRLSPTIETALFRVAQEAMANIRKHAGGPCRVTIELHLGSAAGRFLQICDTGVGTAPGFRANLAGAAGNHVGIAVMHERMAAIGGQLEWRAGPAGGVCVKALLPEHSGL